MPRRRGLRRPADLQRLQSEWLEPRLLLAADPWVIMADQNPADLDDLILVEPFPSDPSQLQVVLNGVVVGTRPIAKPGQIQIRSGRGDDIVRVDVPGLTEGLVIYGGRGNDVIIGGGGPDFIYGGPGDDTLVGGGGNDRIRGGHGHDVLLGGDGDDVLGGGPGADTIAAGSGRDTLGGGPGIDRLFAAIGTDQVFREAIDIFQESKQDNPVFQARGPIELQRFIRATAAAENDGFESLTPATGGGVFSGADLPVQASGAANSSGTNNQVAGVEEADLVKTDGKFIYAILGSELLVIDADPASLAVLSRTPLTGGVSGLFLHGDRVSVVAMEWTWNGSKPQPGVAFPLMIWPGMGSAQTVVSVFDVTDPTAPTVVERTTLDGQLLAARGIGDDIYLVVENRFDPLFTIGGQSGLPSGLPNEAPIFISAGGGDDSLVTVARLSPTDNQVGIDEAAVMAGMGGTVFASESMVYLAGTKWDAAGGPVTILSGFALGGGIRHVASGSVPGFVPNQFAMDEHADGTFRLATQTGLWGASLSSAVYVLERQGLDFVPLGSVAGIAPGESLMAARFIGDEAYIITFLQVDPLFVVDLTDPRMPRVAGELKVPGFSSYLQPMEEDRLFGIGRGDPANTGKLSLFDVSDPTAPAELDSVALGGPDSWTFSEAAWDHRAFSWFRAEGLLAVPVTTWDSNWMDDTTADTFVVSVFAVDRETGFTHAFDVRHDSPVLRSLRIADRLYTVSATTLAVHELGGGQAELARLTIGDRSFSDVSLPVIF